MEAWKRHAAFLEQLAEQTELLSRALQEAGDYARSLEARAEAAEGWAKVMERQAQSLEKQLDYCREEMDRITARPAYRLASHLSWVAGKLLRALRIRR